MEGFEMEGPNHHGSGKSRSGVKRNDWNVKSPCCFTKSALSEMVWKFEV